MNKVIEDEKMPDYHKTSLLATSSNLEVQSLIQI